MAADHHPRYVVREITGYAMSTGRWPLPTTSVWVADSWDCWREVARFYTEDRHDGGGRQYKTRRAAADTVAARLNAEHDAWLRDDGRVS